MYEKKINTKAIDKYVEILSGVEMFEKESPKVLRGILDKMTELFVPGGELLIKEGDTDSTAYILICGRLQVRKRSDESSEDHVIAELAPGEMVGEIGLLTKQKRTASVYAARDSLLLKLTGEKYKEFEKFNLEIAYRIAKASLIRVSYPSKRTLPGENISTIAIAPAGDSNHLKFAKQLISRLSKKYKVCFIDATVCDEYFQCELAQTELHDEGNHKIVRWIQGLEDQYDFLVFVTDRQMTPWTMRSIRESDYILFVAETAVHHTLNSIELSYFSKNTAVNQTSDLIFVHPHDTEKITGSSDWLKDRPVSGFHHIKNECSEHMDRLVRILSGNAIGVVFNGGGARGFAHLGVLRAFREYKVPLDFIGGASMGAIIGGGYASTEIELVKNYAQEFARKYRGDYTFPFIALVKGKRVTDYFRKWFEDIYIEDLWVNFFCVSCNLSKGKLKIHDRGELWKAIRMSTSIPAVFPPLYEDGDMYVDGGIVDNMPVGIMRQKTRGSKIIAVNCCKENKTLSSRTYDTPFVSGWKLLLNSLWNADKEKLQHDNIINVILSSINLASIVHQDMMIEEADYLIEIENNNFGILDFHLFEQIEQAGYEAAVEALSRFDLDLS
jgi:NTE family protein